MQQKRQRQNQKRSKPGKGVVAAFTATGILAGSLLTAGLLYFNPLASGNVFSEARKCSGLTEQCYSLRTQALNEVITEAGLPEYVNSVSYVGYKLGEPGYTTLMGIKDSPLKPRDIGKRIFKADIEVMSGAFEHNSIEAREDFRNALEHEYRHARQIYEGIDCDIGSFAIMGSSMFDQDLYGACMELAAIRESLKDAKISKGYREHQQESYIGHYVNMWFNYDAPHVLHDMKVEYFESWMKSRKEFGVGADGRWYLEHRARKVYLPEIRWK